MKILIRFHLLLFLVQVGKLPLRVSGNPVQEEEETGKYEESEDFLLKNLCDSIEDNEDKKNKCIQCFITISDPEDEMAVAKCIPELPPKVAECVQKMVNPDGEKKFDKCQPKEMEEMVDTVGHLETDTLSIDNTTLEDTLDHVRALHKLWQELNTTLALESLLKFIEQNHKDNVDKFKAITETCEKEIKNPEAMEGNQDVTESVSEDSYKTSDDATVDKDTKTRKRDTQSSDAEYEIRFCDRDTDEVRKIVDCILKNMVESQEILEEIRTYVMEINAPIPSQLVQALLKQRDE